MTKVNTTICFCLIFMASSLFAECSLDHFIVGVNEDGISGTDDDNKLFVGCGQKYRNTGSTSHQTWYYPMSKSFFGDYRLGEPGFDQFQGTVSTAAYTYDPNRCPDGEPTQDYDIIISCVSISSNLQAVPKDSYLSSITTAGQSWDYSDLCDYRNNTHTHMSYRSSNPNMCSITFQLYDDLEKYEPSEIFTIVFNDTPLEGDLFVDGIVNQYDLIELGYYWLEDEGSIYNDYYERADANKDGIVDMLDFALLASNWLDSL